MSTPTEPWRPRPAVEADIEAIRRLEWACFHATISSLSYRTELADPRHAILVLEDDEGLVGFATANVVLDEGHITNIAVDERCRQRGAGRALLTALVERLKQLGATAAYLEVRTRNEAAQHLYTSFGFYVLGKRRAYYWDPPDDAIVMRLDWATPDEAA